MKLLFFSLLLFDFLEFSGSPLCVMWSKDKDCGSLQTSLGRPHYDFDSVLLISATQNTFLTPCCLWKFYSLHKTFFAASTLIELPPLWTAFSTQGLDSNVQICLLFHINSSYSYNYITDFLGVRTKFCLFFQFLIWKIDWKTNGRWINKRS